MGPGLLLFVASVYLLVAVDYALAGRYGMCGAFVCYALANVGFAVDAWR